MPSFAMPIGLVFAQRAMVAMVSVLLISCGGKSDSEVSVPWRSSFYPVEVEALPGNWRIVRIYSDTEDELSLALENGDDRSSYAIWVRYNLSYRDSSRETFERMARERASKRPHTSLIGGRRVSAHNALYWQYDFAFRKPEWNKEMKLSAFKRIVGDRVVTFQWGYPCLDSKNCSAPSHIYDLDYVISIYED